MEVPGLLWENNASLARIQRALTNGEQRQDSEQCQPPDFLRHWREAEGPEERRYLACQAVSKHMEKGMCCLPGILVWLYQLRLQSKLERIWREREAVEQADEAAAAAQETREQLAAVQWPREQWADRQHSHAESQRESGQPEEPLGSDNYLELS